MKDKRRAYEERLDTQLQTREGRKTDTEKAWVEVKSDHPRQGLRIQGSRRSGPTAADHARILAEAIILQSIEDLWHPAGKKGSLLFFQGDGFELCSEIAGISYIGQLAMLRMLAYAGPIINLRIMKKAL